MANGNGPAPADIGPPADVGPAPDNPFTARLGPLPVWAWAAIGGVLVYLWYRHNKGSVQTQTEQPPLTPEDLGTVATLSPTGQGQQFGTTENWGASAVQWAVSHGISGTLAEQTVGDYLNGQMLSQQEEAALNQMIQAVGPPPVPIAPVIGGTPTQSGTTTVPVSSETTTAPVSQVTSGFTPGSWPPTPGSWPPGEPSPGEPMQSYTPPSLSAPSSLQEVRIGSGYGVYQPLYAVPSSAGTQFIHILNPAQEQALASEGTPIYYQPEPGQFERYSGQPLAPGTPLFAQA
jgi:hypothetical protein